MRLLHASSRTHAIFDDERLVSYAGLVPIMRLAQRCDLAGLVAGGVRIAHRCGANAHHKIGSIVAGMVAGADSIDDLDVIRHGGMGRLFGGIRAPSTLGSFLRAMSWGNARQVEKVGRRLLARLASHTPLLPDADVVAFVDLDSTRCRAPRAIWCSPDRFPRAASTVSSRRSPLRAEAAGGRRFRRSLTDESRVTQAAATAMDLREVAGHFVWTLNTACIVLASSL